MEVTGKVHLIQAEEQVSESFKKRLLVVETDGEYPQLIPIDFVQDKTSKPDGFSIGDKVKVSINLRGNEYNDRYYLSAQGWKIEKSDNF